MNARHTLKLTSDGHQTRLELDGHDLTHSVRSVTFHANHRVDLNVAVFAADVQVGDAVIDVPAPTRATLIMLGWTPPREKIITDEEPMRA